MGKNPQQIPANKALRNQNKKGPDNVITGPSKSSINRYKKSGLSGKGSKVQEYIKELFIK
jgi:hypothetical protein